MISAIGTQLPGSSNWRVAVSCRVPDGRGICVTTSSIKVAATSQLPSTLGEAPKADTVPYSEKAPSPSGIRAMRARPTLRPRV